MSVLTAGAAHPATPALAPSGGVRVIGWGAAVPEHRVTNHDLTRHLDTSDEWIVERSGIRERRWAGPGESTGHLAVAACRAALDRAGTRPDQLDAVLLATTTPDHPVPSTAAEVAAALGTTAGEHHLRMDGREVFRRAVRAVEASIERTLARAGCSPEDVALFVPHQANARIVEAVLARTGLDPARTLSTIDRYGNTSASSIPIALSEAADAGTVAPGDLVLMSGFGAGLTVGTALWRWGTLTPAGGDDV